MFFSNWKSGETNSHAVPALYVHYFSRYIITVFIIRSESAHEQSFDLNISGQFNTKAVSSQQCSLTPRTVPFCDYSEVQAKYRLNIALHFNPQPAPFTVTKHRHTIQLHILSVDTAV
jgi:hypothetical protein